MSKQSKTYHFFWSGIYSNWHMCPIKYEIATTVPLEFNCAEQAMMYFKAILFKDFDTAAKIM